MTAKGAVKIDEQKFMSRAEVAALLWGARELGTIPYYLFTLQYLLGLRIGEVIQLRYEHLGPIESGWPLYVEVPTLKKRTQSDAHPPDEATGLPLYKVPVLSHPALVVAAFDPRYRRGRGAQSPWLFPPMLWRTQRHMGRARVFQLWHQARELVQLPPWYSPHALRHTASAYLYERCRSVPQVARFMRHTPSGPRDEGGTTVLYIHFTPEQWARCRGALDLPPLAPLPVARVGYSWR